MQSVTVRKVVKPQPELLQRSQLSESYNIVLFRGEERGMFILHHF